MNEQTIGGNIRLLRARSGLTLTDLARRSAITKSTLSKIETGQISSPVSTLLRIAEALSVPISEFFAEEKENPTFVLTRKGKGPVIAHDGSQWGYSYEALASGMKDKIGEPFLLTIRPGDPDGKFQHGGQEFVYLLSGRVKFSIDQTELELGPGDSLYFDPTHVHRTKVLGKQPARFLCVFLQGIPKSTKSQSK